MKQRLIKGLLGLLASFALVFGMRLGYGYYTHPSGSLPRSATAPVDMAGPLFRLSKKNYAKESVSGADAADQTGGTDQQYEKVASMRALSAAFNEDESKLRRLVEQHNALIQFEQSQGLEGRRRLNMALGVRPHRFDVMVEQIKAIGVLRALRIDKAEKTGEYAKLSAKRFSLEQTRESLLKLKARGGRIEESIALENRLLEIESQIQSLGVKLGDYAQPNEFNTIQLRLDEIDPSRLTISLGHRLKVAGAWTASLYTGALMLLSLALLALWLAMLLAERAYRWASRFGAASKQEEAGHADLAAKTDA